MSAATTNKPEVKKNVVGGLVEPGAIVMNGNRSPPAPGSETEGARSSAARQARVAQAFSQIVAVLMRDPAYQGLTLAELEWLVLPPLLAGQFRVAHATTQSAADKEPQAGMAVPVALALWASVSPLIDKRLSENMDKPVRLRQAEWISGDIPWLMVVAGHPRAVPAFLKQLTDREFKGQQVKMRLRDASGQVDVLPPTAEHAAVTSEFPRDGGDQ